MNERTSEKQIRIAMAERGVRTISQLSKMSGVSRPKLYKMLRGESPYQASLVRIARALETVPRQLIDDGAPVEHN
ncbi:helix-turn-helix domain-containing protein [Trueperella pyogenes]|uniref:helix-turn-helix domain-containing protein n=1 Tax=Trueperella pyogenes TaxID=1661 RepID=UPI003873AA5D